MISQKVEMKVPFGFKNTTCCDAVVLMCLDFRFRKQTLYFARERLQLIAFDLASLPGSSSRFSEESRTARSCFSVPRKFHGVKKIVIVHHEDCGAYGGSGKFSNPKEEQQFHETELRKAKSKILEKYPEDEVILVYARLADDKENIEFLIVK